ncbi:MAG: hypothetical protein N2255_04820 [Kiritimatiellae bacterium]|nr:hypothetical protein [Kiritimatiellia bacterium]
MGIPSLQIREMEPADTEQMLIFRNKIFGQISREQWNAMQCTAVVAVATDAGGDRRFLGAIPLQYRNYRVRNDVTISVVFENAVGVAEETRGMGIGSKMLDEAARFLHDRVEAMFVYRGGERSPGYRFYRKNNHGDLYYLQPLEWYNPLGSCNSVEVLPATEALPMEDEILRIFRYCYDGMAGYWERVEGFYSRILASHVYRSDEWRLFLDRHSGKLEGYALVNPSSLAWKGYCIYEIAALTRPSVRRLIERIGFEAGVRQQSVTIPINHEHPFRDQLLKLGFRVTGDSPYVLARLLRPDLIFRRLAKGSRLLSLLRLVVITPHRDIVVNEPPRTEHEVTLWCKESQLSRLFCCRLDPEVAFRTNQIRLSPVPPAVRRELWRIFRFSRWVVFGTDYI